MIAIYGSNIVIFEAIVIFIYIHNHFDDSSIYWKVEINSQKVFIYKHKKKKHIDTSIYSHLMQY